MASTKSEQVKPHLEALYFSASPHWRKVNALEMSSRRMGLATARRLADVYEHFFVGVHPTLCLECRDATRGVGGYVTDACDEGTVAVVIPQTSRLQRSSLCAPKGGFCIDDEMLQKLTLNFGENRKEEAAFALGLNAIFRTAASTEDYSWEWLHFVWAVAVERHLMASPFSFWFTMGDATNVTSSLRTSTEIRSRVLAEQPHLLSSWTSSIGVLQRELKGLYARLKASHLAPPWRSFVHAAHEVLSRSVALPGSRCDGTFDTRAPLMRAIPLGLDMLNTAWENSAAEVEVAESIDELPVWYLEDHGADLGNGQRIRGRSDCERLQIRWWHFPFLLVTLKRSLVPGDEVTVPYETPLLDHEAAKWLAGREMVNTQDITRLGQLLRYGCCA